jgi:hypothetical protein
VVEIFDLTGQVGKRIGCTDADDKQRAQQPRNGRAAGGCSAAMKTRPSSGTA